MTHKGMLIGLLALLPALAAQSQEPGEVGEEVADTALDVETILTTPSETEYTESERCLSTSRIRRTEVLDDRHIVFHMSRDRYYLVQFPHRCPTLDKNSALMYDVQGSRLCQLNRIRAVNGSGMSRSIGPVCMLPAFEEVSIEQVALIRESLEELRRKKRAGPTSPSGKGSSEEASPQSDSDQEEAATS